MSYNSVADIIGLSSFV